LIRLGFQKLEHHEQGRQAQPDALPQTHVCKIVNAEKQSKHSLEIISFDRES